MTLLSIREVSKSFGGLQALYRVDAVAETGRITALIGPNGAGKTTLINIISGLDRPTSGTITFDGQGTDQLAPWEITRRGIARTFQVARLFRSMTVLENVMVGRHPRSKAETLAVLLRLSWVRAEEETSRERALEMLEFVGLREKADQVAVTLAYGQQRMVELARALASEPKLLLLDEPAAGLNPSETEALQRVLRAVRAQGITILLVEHHMRMVMNLSDKVVVLNYGQKIAEGQPAVISKDPKVVEAYLGKGFGRAGA